MAAAKMLRKKFSFLTSLAAHHGVLAEAGPGLPVLIKHGGQISGHYLIIFHIQSNCLRVFFGYFTTLLSSLNGLI